MVLLLHVSNRASSAGTGAPCGCRGGRLLSREPGHTLSSATARQAKQARSLIGAAAHRLGDMTIGSTVLQTAVGTPGRQLSRQRCPASCRMGHGSGTAGALQLLREDLGSAQVAEPADAATAVVLCEGNLPCTAAGTRCGLWLPAEQRSAISVSWFIANVCSVLRRCCTSRTPPLSAGVCLRRRCALQDMEDRAVSVDATCRRRTASACLGALWRARVSAVDASPVACRCKHRLQKSCDPCEQEPAAWGTRGALQHAPAAR